MSGSPIDVRPAGELTGVLIWPPLGPPPPLPLQQVYWLRQGGECGQNSPTSAYAARVASNRTPKIGIAMHFIAVPLFPSLPPSCAPRDSGPTLYRPAGKGFRCGSDHTRYERASSGDRV